MSKGRRFLFLILFSWLGGVHASYVDQSHIDPNHVACIQILPITLQSLQEVDVHTPKQESAYKEEVHFARYAPREGQVNNKNLNEYGLGHTFQYVNKSELPESAIPQEVLTYLSALRDLAPDYVGERNNFRNLLFSRVDFESDQESLASCYLGFFISGNERYSISTKKYGEVQADDLFNGVMAFDSCTKLPSDISAGFKNELQTEWRAKFFATDTLNRYSVIGNYEDMDPKPKVTVYQKRVLELPIGQVKKRFFAPLTVSDRAAGIKLRDVIMNRLYGELFDRLPGILHLEGGSISTGYHLFDETFQNTKDFLDDPFLGFKGKGYIDSMFAQSEQAFLNLLDDFFATDSQFSDSYFFPSFSPNFLEILTSQGLNNPINFHCKLTFYSFLDICKYCRGTLSLVSGNSYLKERFEDMLNKFIRKKLEDIAQDTDNINQIHLLIRSINDGQKSVKSNTEEKGHFLKIDSLKVFAFSFDSALVGMAPSSQQQSPGKLGTGKRQRGAQKDSQKKRGKN